MSTRYCKDCRHARQEGRIMCGGSAMVSVQVWRCLRPLQPSPVDGSERFVNRDCEGERDNGSLVDNCGGAGQYWEAKEDAQ